MPVMNFDLEDGLDPVSFTLKHEDAERFISFMQHCYDLEQTLDSLRRHASEVEDDREALLVKVAQLKEAGDALRHELAQWSLTERDPETASAMCQFDHLARESSGAYLARRDARTGQEACRRVTGVLRNGIFDWDKLGGDPREQAANIATLVGNDIAREAREYDGSYVENHCSECNEYQSECTCHEEPAA